MLKLDLGAGPDSPEGFLPRGNAHGSAIFPLSDIADGSCAVVRASHVLEHFPRQQIPVVLREWARVLAPGGELRIAVPDLKIVAERYLEGVNQPTEAFIMGGQVDAADYHQALFDAESLQRSLSAAGLMLIRRWDSELADCAALDISLNLSGTKPDMPEIAVSAVMSVPRLGFMDNFFSAIEAFPGLGVKLRRYQGAYWGQCIERVMEESLAEDSPDAILAVDYDSIFTRRDVAMLMQLMCCHPEADAIAAVQAARGRATPLFTLGADAPSVDGRIATSAFAGDLTRAETAHFGLTLIRADKLRGFAKPWFRDVPDQDGGWGEGRTDADVNFWRQWQAAGNSLFLANRVPIGHLELGVLWPGSDLGAISQPVADWRKSGPPKDIWK